MTDRGAEMRTTTRMEEVEVELYQCPMCDQEFEEEEMAEIGLDKREVAGGMKTRHHATSAICVYCAENWFDYERPSSSFSWTHTPGGNTVGQFNRPKAVAYTVLAINAFAVGISFDPIKQPILYAFLATTIVGGAWALKRA